MAGSVGEKCFGRTLKYEHVFLNTCYRMFSHLATILKTLTSRPACPACRIGSRVLGTGHETSTSPRLLSRRAGSQDGGQGLRQLHLAWPGTVTRKKRVPKSRSSGKRSSNRQLSCYSLRCQRSTTEPRACAVTATSGPARADEAETPPVALPGAADRGARSLLAGRHGTCGGRDVHLAGAAV